MCRSTLSGYYSYDKKNSMTRSKVILDPLSYRPVHIPGERHGKVEYVNLHLTLCNFIFKLNENVWVSIAGYYSSDQKGSMTN